MKYCDSYHPSDQLLFRSLEEGEYELTSDKLINLRARRFTNDHRVHLHYHNTIEINVNHGVKGMVWIDGISIPLDEIDLLVTPPGTMHSFDFTGGGGTFNVLHISLTQLGEYINLKKIFGEDLVNLKRISFRDNSYSELKNVMEEMKNISEEDFFSQLQLILQSLSIIFRTSHHRQTESKNSSMLKKVINYTERNFSEKIDLDDISDYVGLSRSYFSRFFKKTTGTGYFTYLKLMRLERAKEHLRLGESVTESCYSCGFDNVSYFIQLFKNNNNGISPGKFRE